MTLLGARGWDYGGDAGGEHVAVVDTPDNGVIGSFFRGPGFNFVFPWHKGIFFDL